MHRPDVPHTASNGHTDIQRKSKGDKDLRTPRAVICSGVTP